MIFDGYQDTYNDTTQRFHIYLIFLISYADFKIRSTRGGHDRSYLGVHSYPFSVILKKIIFRFIGIHSIRDTLKYSHDSTSSNKRSPRLVLLDFEIIVRNKKNKKMETKIFDLATNGYVF